MKCCDNCGKSDHAVEGSSGECFVEETTLAMTFGTDDTFPKETIDLCTDCFSVLETYLREALIAFRTARNCQLKKQSKTEKNE